MVALLNAETQRFMARRITRFFPSALATLLVAGFVIAYFVISSQDASVDFVDDLAFDQMARQDPGASSILGPLGFLLPIMAYTLGASFYGADEKNGVIELLMTWEPRRLRLLGARAIGGAAMTAALGILVAAVCVGGMYVLAAMTGTTAGMSGQMWWWVAATVLRTGLLCAAFFIFGMSLTVLLNSSVASIIAFVIYAFVLENVLTLFVGRIAPWLPMGNADAFSSGRSLRVFSLSNMDGSTPDGHHSWLVAGIVVLMYAAVSFLAAALVFSRRDVD